jgi:hypothetical protein
MESVQIEAQSRRLIDVLKGQDYVALFQAAAKRLLDAGDGQLATADRLKRQPFTQELLTRLRVADE